MELSALTAFFGYCSLINMAILSCSAIILLLFKDSISSIHKALFNVEQSTLNSLYLQFIALYKLLIIVFNLIPFLVLWLFIS